MPGHLTRNASQLTWFRSPAGSRPSCSGPLAWLAEWECVATDEFASRAGLLPFDQHARAEHLGRWRNRSDILSAQCEAVDAPLSSMDDPSACEGPTRSTARWSYSVLAAR